MIFKSLLILFFCASVSDAYGKSRYKGPGPSMYSKSKGGPLKATKALGEECKGDGECIPAFSRCEETCKCRNGFTQEDDICKTDEVGCPFGKPNGETPAPCTRWEEDVSCPEVVDKNGMNIAENCTDRVWKDDCPEGQYCQYMSVHANNLEGRCCLRPQLTCPYGEPHKTKTCHKLSKRAYDCIIKNTAFGKRHRVKKRPPSMKYSKKKSISYEDDMKQLKKSRREEEERRNEWMEMDPYCPRQSHFCYGINAPGAHFEEFSQCCPQACAPWQIFSDSKCYNRASLGEKCEIEHQCGHYKCLDGVCSCRPGEIMKHERWGVTCRSPSCPSGYGNHYSVIRNSDDNLPLRCEDAAECQRNSGNKDSFCTWEGFCCPKPEPSCYHHSYGFNKRRCDPTEGRCGFCPNNHVCESFYFGPGANQTDGICCPTLRNLECPPRPPEPTTTFAPLPLPMEEPTTLEP